MKLFGESFVYKLLFCLLTNTDLYECCILLDHPYVCPKKFRYFSMLNAYYRFRTIRELLSGTSCSTRNYAEMININVPN